MGEALRVLLVEDSVDDAMLVEYQLRSEQLQFASKRVGTKNDFEQAIRSATWDVILADFLWRSSMRWKKEKGVEKGSPISGSVQ